MMTHLTNDDNRLNRGNWTEESLSQASDVLRLEVKCRHKMNQRPVLMEHVTKAGTILRSERPFR